MDPHPKADKSIQTLEMPTDPVIIHELSEIEKIVRDEMWLEGERRGGYVPPDDPVVRENVCRVILRPPPPSSATTKVPLRQATRRTRSSPSPQEDRQGISARR